jgi:hypothetical protein
MGVDIVAPVLAGGPIFVPLFLPLRSRFGLVLWFSEMLRLFFGSLNALGSVSQRMLLAWRRCGQRGGSRANS